MVLQGEDQRVTSPRTHAPQHTLKSTAKETLMNLAYVTETVIGLALVSIGVGWFVAGLAYLATRPNDR